MMFLVVVVRCLLSTLLCGLLRRFLCSFLCGHQRVASVFPRIVQMPEWPSATFRRIAIPASHHALRCSNESSCSYTNMAVPPSSSTKTLKIPNRVPARSWFASRPSASTPSIGRCAPAPPRTASLYISLAFWAATSPASSVADRRRGYQLRRKATASLRSHTRLTRNSASSKRHRARA